MSESIRCEQCGGNVPADAPDGLCPRCLLHAGVSAAATSAHFPADAAPTPAELQPFFPGLEILELLGRGGMGAVYKARQIALDRCVAIKILPPRVGADPAFAERFTREARALARLSHPNIIAVHDFGQAGGLYYFVMEYVEGVNVRQALRAGQITPAEALKILPQLCDALQFAHDEGIIHRDIKPENILLDLRGRVKMADFGLAKLVGQPIDVTLTGTRQAMGTLHYMAPEQAAGARDVDHRADIYSLGVTFYEMLTGELPLGRFAPPSQRVRIDVRLDEVVLRTLEQRPEQRYQHASDVKTEVETIVRTPGPAAVPAPDLEHPFLAGTRVLMTPQPGYAAWVGLPTLALLAAFLAAGCVGSFVIDSANETALMGLRYGGPALLGVVFMFLNLFWLTRRGRTAAATVPGRSWSVPVIGVLNLTVGVVFMLLASFDLFIGNDPTEALGKARDLHPALYDAWRLASPLVHYATSAGFFFAGIGLLLWRPWARRLAVGVAVAELALFVVELPALVLFSLGPLFDDLPNWGGPDEDWQFFTGAFVASELALFLAASLVFLIGQIVVLNRPRVAAAFGADAPRRA